MKKREIVLLMILLIMLCGMGYYFFYFTPTNERITELQTGIDQKSADIDIALQQVLVWSSLSNQKGTVEKDWKKLSRTLPKNFDDADIIDRVEKIIIPHTTDILIKFPDQAEPLETTEINTVEMTFIVPYDTLQEILKAFADEDIANRIIDITCTRVEDEETEDSYTINMLVDFLTLSPIPADDENEAEQNGQ